VLELFKPVTWFPPMWAFSCGVVSSGVSIASHWQLLLLGVLLTGPLVCGTSQAINDWFDRHVDAINEPHRPIPSGRMPGTWGLTLAIAGTLVSLIVGLQLGWAACAATVLAVIMAWIYSAPPLRLKNNGWWGNAAVGFTYEGLAWVTGAALMLNGTVPRPAILLAAVLYSIGAHGIMTLNDFKSVEGDLAMGIGSLPARLGPARAAKVACVVMLVPQVIVVGMLAIASHPVAALLVGGVLLAQLPLMRRLLRHPRELAPWYNQTGITLYVSGMMVTAVALGSGR
jgi:chlorophyll synthase